MTDLNYKILSSIDKIDRADWDMIFGDIPEGYDFFKAVENSRLEGFGFNYVVICDDKSPLLIAPLFTADFNLAIAVDGIGRKVVDCIGRVFPRFLIMKTLFCGSPFGENGILGIKSGFNDKDTLILKLAEILDIICKKDNIPFVILKDFLKNDLPILEKLKTKGFFEIESFPSVTTELNFKSMDDYFASLSYHTRKSIRRKIKKANSEAGIEVKITGSVEDIIEDVYRLYLNTYNAGQVKFEKLSKEFFISVADNMGPRCKFFLYFVNGKLGAFNLCFLHRNTLIDKFIGFDYDLSHKYNLYSYSWCYNIEWCLKNSVSHYQVGQTDYHPKLMLGGRLVPLYAFARHNNRILNSALQLVSKFMVPSHFDDNIKSDAKK